MGDFNSTQKELKKTEIQNLGLQTTQSLAGFPTFPSFSSLLLRKKAIDHIIHGPAFEVETCSRVKGNSDHFMLSCELKH